MPSAASEQELSDLLIELWEFAQSDEFREICDNGLVCETYAGCSFHPSQVALPRALAEERLQEKKIANMHCTESIGLMLKFLVGFTQLNAAARRKAYKKHFAKYRADHMNQPKNYFRLYPLPPYSQFCTSKSKKNAGYGTLEVEYGILDKRHHLTSESKIQMSFEMAYLATIFGLVFSGETTVNGLQKWLGKHFACSQEKVYRCVMANKNDLHTIGWDPTTGIRTNHNNNNNVLHEMANLVRRMEEAQEKIHSDLQNLAQKTDLQNLAQKIEGVEAAVTDGRQSNLQDLTGLRSEFAQKIEVVRAAVVESKNSNAQDFAGLRSELLNVKQSVATQQDVMDGSHSHVNDVTSIKDGIAELRSELVRRLEEAQNLNRDELQNITNEYQKLKDVVEGRHSNHQDVASINDGVKGLRTEFQLVTSEFHRGKKESDAKINDLIERFEELHKSTSNLSGVAKSIDTLTATVAQLAQGQNLDHVTQSIDALRRAMTDATPGQTSPDLKAIMGSIDALRKTLQGNFSGVLLIVCVS